MQQVIFTDVHSVSGEYKYRGLVLRDGGWAWGLQPYPVKREVLRNLQEIQPDFVEEAKA
jgi:hypothetical protein